MGLRRGQKIGRYRLLEQVGKGGMAEVFRAETVRSDGSKETVAVKRLFPRLAADREFVGMFVNEARIASHMAHPNVVRTFDLINAGSYYYIVMEYLEGMDLEDLMALAPPGQMAMTLHEAAYVVGEVARGLDYAHRGGGDPDAGPVVHRDISPGNIMVDRKGRVLITDFGIARAAQYAQVTQPGILKGKYEYMAPEYIQGKPFDGRADLFSLGVVLYELLTGENPFVDVLPMDVWNKILDRHPPPPSKVSPEVPRAMDLVVDRALKKEPRKRIPSGEVFAKLLEPFLASGGKQPCSKQLGKRVAKAMRRPDVRNRAGDLAEYLPDDGYGAPSGDQTYEMHLDDLLQLVEPVDVPRPDFAAVSRELNTSGQLRLGRLRSRLRKKRLLWTGLGLLLLLATGVYFWLIAGRPTGYLTVTSNRRSEVTVDDRPMGVTPLERLVLPVGRHTIAVRRPGSSRTKRFERNLADGQHRKLRVRWDDPSAKKSKPTKRKLRKKRKRSSTKAKRKKHKR